MDKEKLKKNYGKVSSFLSEKKVQNIIVLIFLLAFIILGVQIRIQNLPLLVDQTTGDYIPLALDPYYFLRVAETMVETGGDMPLVDGMRAPALNMPWTSEILPSSIVLIYKITKVFSPEISLRLIDVLSPVIFFVLGLIVFFFLIYFLTKSRWIGLLSVGLLTVIPPYLYRSMTGFSDHDILGMLGFYTALLLYTLSINYLDKKSSSKKSYLGIIGLGILSGIATTFSIVSWGGMAKFVFMIIPLSFLIIWLVKTRESKKELWKYPLFYSSWFIFMILGGILFSYSMNSIIGGFVFSYSSILTPLVLVFVIMDYLMIKYGMNFLKEKQKKLRIIYSGIASIILGGVLYQIFIGNIFELLRRVFSQVLTPFGTDRISLTVAENKQPYLNDWISQIGKRGFWVFVGGLIVVGINLARGIRAKRGKIEFFFIWLLFISGLLFSRISETSILNGNNLLSKLFLFGSVALFGGYCIYLYFKKDFSFGVNLIIIASWLVPMVLAARSAVRTFFGIVPFACFMMGYGLFELYKNRNLIKDDVARFGVYILIILLIIGLIFSGVNFTKYSLYQAKYTGPSADYQWQNAMGWIRDNTPEESVFIHWWDYGYWVQTLGERTTIVDGGHPNGYWDHLIGRYLLTTPYPETAKSLMKTQEVNYLLIDQTDIGKYSAYSSIGDDKEISDRASYIPAIVSDPSQNVETRTGVIRFYNGGFYLDSDIIYLYEGEEIFLPKGKAALGGLRIEIENNSLKKPIGVYFYNGKQYALPIRYAFISEELVDFGEGVNSTLFFFTNLNQNSASGMVDPMGAVLYLSEKTKDSLLAKLYLMNDPLGEYSELSLVHSERDQVYNFLKVQGVKSTEFIYYQGVRGPIKIWEFNPGEDILVREEFLRTSGEYGEFDDLEFIK